MTPDEAIAQMFASRARVLENQSAHPALASPGLSIRDHFAGLAMLALIPLFSYGTLSLKDGKRATEADISEQAYAFADEMLAEREKEQA